MLKIKDNVSFEYLEEKYKLNRTAWNDISYGLSLYNEGTKELSLKIMYDKTIFVLDRKGCNILFDLMQDGLIEKVEDD